MAPPTSPKGPKRSFFSRRASEKTAPVSHPVVGSASAWSTPSSTSPGAGQVRVKVGLQDVCLRLVSEMGLYETRTGMAVVVGVEIGS